MMFTVHRASTGADWHQATALLYDYVEWMRAWIDLDPLVEQPLLHAELASLADHYATDTAALYLVVCQAIAVGAVAIRAQPDGSAELKRLYVRPIARGRGHRWIDSLTPLSLAQPSGSATPSGSRRSVVPWTERSRSIGATASSSHPRGRPR